MNFSITKGNKISLTSPVVILGKTVDDILSKLDLKELKTHFQNNLNDKNTFVSVTGIHNVIGILTKEDGLESIRKNGHKTFELLKGLKLSQIQIIHANNDESETYAFLEGLTLSTYTFDRHKAEKSNFNLAIQVCSDFNQIDELVVLVSSVFQTRDLVNEPVNFLNAEDLSKAIQTIGKNTGFSVEVWNQKEVERNKMGGLLAVNKGSIDPCTFTILEYSPKTALNSKPIILVGKGVVYDTGGLSLKPTQNSMDMMKCDMAGAGVVIGAISALTQNKVPVHIIGLIPATDNRPGGNALAPGDVITMHDGKTVEVLNTDAEGRLILADALSYAKKYDPELVIDLATLTGSAVRAIGEKAIAMMGTASDETKDKLKESGNVTFERIVEFPLWEDYNESLKSNIADLNNVGGANAGAITAGKFLEHFTSYNWIHLDIAGPSFLTKKDNYWGNNGTGVGVRLIYNFIKSTYGTK